MRLKSEFVPDNISKLMSPADRKELGVLTPVERTAKADDKAEKELQRLCEQELSRRGIEYIHLSFRAREKRGYPDLTFAMNGTPIAVELKSAIGKLSEDQIRVMQRMEQNGWKTYIVRSFEHFRGILNMEE